MHESSEMRSRVDDLLTRVATDPAYRRALLERPAEALAGERFAGTAVREVVGYAQSAQCTCPRSCSRSCKWTT